MNELDINYYEMKKQQEAIMCLAINPSMVVAPLSCETEAKAICQSKAKYKKDENPMNYNSTVCVAQSPVSDETAKQRRYMAHRIESDYYTKKAELVIQFNIDPIYPNSPKEMDELLKAGHYTIRGLDDAKTPRYWSSYDALEFRKAPADKDGFEAAKTALKAVRQDAIDIVSVLPLDKGFDAMKSFADWKYSAK